jgi:hypothetical protein
MSLRHAVPLLLGRLSAKLPPAVDAQIWRYLRLSKPQQLVRLTGTTHAGTTGTLIVGGHDPLEEFLPNRFFASTPEVVALGNVSVFQLQRRLRELRATADLTAVKLDRVLIRSLFKTDYLRVPEWMRSSMPIPESIEKVASGHNSLRQDLRLIRKHQLGFVESHLEADLLDFFNTMYRPHGYGRHGPSAQLRSFASVRYAMKRGALLWITCEGQKVAGVVLEFKNRRMILSALGAAGGDEGLMKKGVLSATYYFSMQYARTQGCPIVDFGGTRPSLHDGLLRYKRKWGAVIDPKPLNPFDTLVWWPVLNPSVAAVLKTTPLVFRDHGALSALQLDSEPPLTPELTRGLRRVCLVAAGTPFDGSHEKRSLSVTASSC